MKTDINEGATMTLTLHELTARTGREVYDWLDDDVLPVYPCTDPVVQGDVICIPAALAPAAKPPTWTEPTGAGVVLVAGEHEHVAQSDPGACRVGMLAPGDADVAVLDVTTTCWLLHAQHGGFGLGEGRWTIRRQREGVERRLVAD